MEKEQLKKYLADQSLVQAIRQKKQIDDTLKMLHAAIDIANKTGISEAAISEIRAKSIDYGKISQGYDCMIEDAWNVTWQKQAIIRRYVDCTEFEIDKLPNELRL